MEGLEPPSLAALDPKSSVSTNFTTPALGSANVGNKIRIDQIQIWMKIIISTMPYYETLAAHHHLLPHGQLIS